jgi:hypothetical protein
MVTVADLREVRSYPGGVDLARLGTFPEPGGARHTVVRRGRSMASG